MNVLLMIGGLLALVLGAELFVRGASKLAVAIGISPLVVGLTVVAFGTSAPELVTSIHATTSGRPDVALGNVVGSNIFNVLFILGVSASIVPLVVSQQLIRFDVPLMIGLSGLVLIFALDGRIGRGDGFLLTVGLIAYTTWVIVVSRREQAGILAEYEAEFGPAENPHTRSSSLANIVLLSAGFGLLVIGSRLFVDGSTQLARQWGVSELVTGLTIVAAGTSLPEVATSIVAAIRGERDIAVGNVVGSNIFNILAVLGVASFVSPDGVAVSPNAISFDIPVMVAVAVACLPVFFTGHTIARWEGGLFLGYYCAYTGYLVMLATASSLTAVFAVGMLGFVIPLTVLTLLIGVVRALRGRKASDCS